MMSKMDEVFKRVLNDEDIFSSPYDKDKREKLPKLFEGKEWSEILYGFFNRGDQEKFNGLVDINLKKVLSREKNSGRRKQSKISDLKKLANDLKSAFVKKRNLLRNMFGNLNWFGLVTCNLPDMDDYGGVIERYEKSVVEVYFVDKIKRAYFPQNRAIGRVLEYVKELYFSKVSAEEISYFVRKLKSLEKYWEVLR